MKLRVAFVCVLFVCAAGYFGWQIGYVQGVEAASEKEPFRHGQITIWNKSGVPSYDRIGGALYVTPSPTGTLLSGYRKHDTGEWDERIEFFIPKETMAEIRALPEGMVAQYGVEPSPAAEGPVPITKEPVPYDDSPRFTVDPPE